VQCGILNDRLGGQLDMVSYGPTIREAHSPDEMCYVPSVLQFWQLTQALMSRLADLPAQA
jgi:dipeptidase D